MQTDSEQLLDRGRDARERDMGRVHDGAGRQLRPLCLPPSRQHPSPQTLRDPRPRSGARLLDVRDAGQHRVRRFTRHVGRRCASGRRARRRPRRPARHRQRTELPHARPRMVIMRTAFALRHGRPARRFVVAWASRHVCGAARRPRAGRPCPFKHDHAAGHPRLAGAALSVFTAAISHARRRDDELPRRRATQRTRPFSCCTAIPRGHFTTANCSPRDRADDNALHRAGSYRDGVVGETAGLRLHARAPHRRHRGARRDAESSSACTSWCTTGAARLASASRRGTRR